MKKVPGKKDTTREKVEKRRAERRRERDAPQTALGRLFASPVRIAVVVFAVAFLLYANTLGHGFVWDDLDLIVNNPQMGELGAGDAGKVFVSKFWQGYQNASYYRPLVTLSYHIQHKVFDGNPAGFHFANVMWHAITCVLVFLFVWFLFGRTVIAAITALVFAAHPLHTESVAWISGRTDVLSTLWAMASLLLYLQFRRRGNVLFLAGALVSFLLSLFAKESSAFLPVIVVLLELPPLRALTLRGAKRPEGTAQWTVPAAIAGMFAVLVVYFVMRAHVLGTPFSSYPGYAPGALGTVALPLSVFAGYVYKVIAPFMLNAEWDAPVPESFTALPVIAGFVLAAAILFLLVRFRRNAAVVLGIAFFVIGVGPVVNVFPIGEISAERFLYFPILGFALVLGAVFEPSVEALAAGRRRGRDLAWVLLILLVAYAARTVTRNTVWADEKTLFTATVEAAPDSPRAWVNLGDVARREGRLDDTIRLYKRALEVDADFTLALSNLAGVYVQMGRLDEATPLIERAVRSEPDNAGLLANLGSLYLEQGKLDQAADALERAVALSPDHPTANFSLGVIRFRQQRYDAARAHFERVADAGRAYAMADYYLAVIEMETGNPQRAAARAQRFLQTHPQNDEYGQRARAIIRSATER